ncbi:MAG: ABC transporter substrate-binding protein [Bacteroidales bacterium]|nr:ABC transporter substrate-binding protein [Bacteroidales bacterium]
MRFKIPFISFFFFLALAVAAQKTEPVKIGLLIQDKTTLAAKHGAELAIKTANENGGLNGRPFQLIIKSMEGPWGTGSKQAVALIFEDEVWALLGSHDGRNAHLVEQAATRSIVPFVSVWSSDPTLSQAFVPWFFNCVPNDRQQADALIKEIYTNRKLTRIATISDQVYDSNLALKNYLHRIQQGGEKEPLQFIFENFQGDMDAMADQLTKAKINALVLFCQSSASMKIIRLLRQRKMNLPVFGSLSILNEDVLSGQELHELANRVYVPSPTLSGSKNMTFRQDYQKTFGNLPGMAAAFAYDGMNVLIEAIRLAGGPEREKIQQSLLKLNHEGVTGHIQFDGKGNRLGSFTVSLYKP